MEQIKGAVRKTFFAGLVVVVPIIITALAFIWLFQIVDGFLSPVFHGMLGIQVPGLGLLVTIALIFITGLLAKNVLGVRLLQFIQGLLMRLPLVKKIYPMIRQLVEAFSPASSSSFKRVVLVEYPKKGIFSLGFLTNEVSMHRSAERTHYCSVYIPTNNLYIGQMALFKPEEVIVTGFTIEEGLKIVLSGGTSFPSSITGQNLKSDS